MSYCEPPRNSTQEAVATAVVIAFIIIMVFHL